MRISDEHASEGLTLDQLIAELQAAKSGGHATGREKVILGTGFLYNCWPVRSVAVEKTEDGTLAVGMSSETKEEWLKKVPSVICYEVAPARTAKSRKP